MRLLFAQYSRRYVIVLPKSVKKNVMKSLWHVSQCEGLVEVWYIVHFYVLVLFQVQETHELNRVPIMDFPMEAPKFP